MSVLTDVALTLTDTAEMVSQLYDEYGLACMALLTVAFMTLLALDVGQKVTNAASSVLLAVVIVGLGLWPAACTTRVAAEMVNGKVPVAEAFLRHAPTSTYVAGWTEARELYEAVRACETLRSSLLSEGKCVETTKTQYLTTYRLVCADGWTGSSCGCGGGRGCCSWHGGIGYCQTNVREQAHTYYDGMRVGTPEGFQRASDCDCIAERTFGTLHYKSAAANADETESIGFAYLTGWNDEASKYDDFNELIFPPELSTTTENE